MRRRNSLGAMPEEDPKARTDSEQTPSLSTARVTILWPLLAACYYISISVSLTLFNKLLFSRFPASDPPFLLLCQSITAVAMLTVLHLLGKFSPPNLLSWSRASFRIYAPLYISNLVMLLTSLIALKFTSLLMYNTLRRTSMIFVVTIHCAMHRTRPSPFTVGATVLVTAGAIVASYTDLAYDPLGYALAFTANLSTAIYLVFLKPVRDKLQLSNLQLVYVNALANIPAMLVILLVMPPNAAFLSLFKSITFDVLFFCSCGLAVVINHAIFVNTTTNDAIAQSIASQLKDVALLIISIIFIDDPKQRAAGNLQGVFVGFLGSVVYGVGKLRERYAARKEEQSNESNNNGENKVAEKIYLVSQEVKHTTP